MAEDRDERDMQEHIIRTEGQTEASKPDTAFFTPETLAADHERRSNATYAHDPELQGLRIERLVELFQTHEERWQEVAQKMETLDKRFTEYEKRLERYEERERDREREQGWERSR